MATRKIDPNDGGQSAFLAKLEATWRSVDKMHALTPQGSEVLVILDSLLHALHAKDGGKSLSLLARSARKLARENAGLERLWDVKEPVAGDTNDPLPPLAIAPTRAELGRRIVARFRLKRRPLPRLSRDATRAEVAEWLENWFSPIASEIAADLLRYGPRANLGSTSKTHEELSKSVLDKLVRDYWRHIRGIRLARLRSKKSGKPARRISPERLAATALVGWGFKRKQASDVIRSAVARQR